MRSRPGGHGPRSPKAAAGERTTLRLKIQLFPPLHEDQQCLPAEGGLDSQDLSVNFCGTEFIPDDQPKYLRVALARSCNYQECMEGTKQKLEGWVGNTWKEDRVHQGQRTVKFQVNIERSVRASLHEMRIKRAESICENSHAFTVSCGTAFMQHSCLNVSGARQRPNSDQVSDASEKCISTEGCVGVGIMVQNSRMCPLTLITVFLLPVWDGTAATSFLSSLGSDFFVISELLDYACWGSGLTKALIFGEKRENSVVFSWGILAVLIGPRGSGTSWYGIFKDRSVPCKLFFFNFIKYERLWNDIKLLWKSTLDNILLTKECNHSQNVFTLRTEVYYKRKKTRRVKGCTVFTKGALLGSPSKNFTCMQFWSLQYKKGMNCWSESRGGHEAVEVSMAEWKQLENGKSMLRKTEGKTLKVLKLAKLCVERQRLMACNGRADRICTSIVIYNKFNKPCKCSSSNVAIHNEIYVIMGKPLGNELAELVMLLEWWSGTECTLFSDEATVNTFGKEHVIIILNHNFEIDFLCGWTMTERFGVLGSSKVLAKRELLYVPLIGWTWYFLEIVFCKRKWEEDRDTVIEGLKRLSDYPEYMWFLLYCEGTRFTETKHRISMEVAESKGLPKLKYHLLPRTKGFTTAVQCLRGTVSAVYDVTLNFRGNKNPSLLGILYGKKYEADMCVRRFPLEDIPQDEKEAANWLHKLYQEKDALQEMYNQEGVFPGKQFKPPRRPWTLLNFLFWATVLLSPLFTFGFGVFASGSPLLILAFLGLVGAVWTCKLTAMEFSIDSKEEWFSDQYGQMMGAFGLDHEEQ
ncbi:hypothetical protein WISP_50426 [Willisornis vidua]|uniref:Phospholipid/glycerol acyltransferase domain-containing protein n=1 Tax=Willisornis vidua TaxID=1566151 RepID=A0ABQ9DDW8_9PASS|nr:hypothetical protein WISP_50426 [Willisornis vidua]